MIFCNDKDGKCSYRANGLISLFLIMLSAWLGIKAWNGIREHKFIGVPIEQHTITVTGEGKVIAVPDIAMIQLGMMVEKKTVAEAQGENTKTMNSIIAKLKEFGVDAKDIQTTNYNISPVYDYDNGRSTLRGYQVSQNVQVKVRKLDKAGEILGIAGSLGANQVGGINFMNEDPEALRQEARLEAIANAREKAEALAKASGVTLRRVISFSESTSGGYPIYFGYGGDKRAEASAPAPTIEPGSNDIIINASVTYEIE
jgi:uncharacterized protein YggE